MTRQTKTPRARAQEALDVATRAVKRFGGNATVLRNDLAEVVREAATARLTYVRANPDLGDIGVQEGLE